MKFDELKKRSAEDLKKDLQAAELELMRYNALAATGGAGKEVGKVKQIKKTIARIKTLQQRK